MRKALIVALVLLSLAPVGVTYAQQEEPSCATVCSKIGVNYATAVRQPTDEYLHAQQLGMRWVMEIAFHPDDVLRTAEAINRAHDHGLNPIIRICAGQTCPFSNTRVFAVFLRDVSEHVDGPFWVTLGPNEPELEQWGGSPEQLAAYMNDMLDLTQDIPHLRTVSPIFNVTNAVTHNFFRRMERAGARFSDLDAFSGTSYNISGRGAYYYYAQHTGHAETMRAKAARYDKPFIFAEFGTFGMFDKPAVEGHPDRQPIVRELRLEFEKAAGDSTIMAILLFDGFGLHGTPHRLFDSEIVRIADSPRCTGAGVGYVGIGMSTDQTLWQLDGEGICREVTHGCPFLRAQPCDNGVCVDNDDDGFPAGLTCERTDCDDSDDATAESCGAHPYLTEWGTVYPVETGLPLGEVTMWPQVAVRSDGRPFITYHDAQTGQRDLTALDCQDALCQTAYHQVLTTENIVGEYPSLTLLADDRPFIAHYDATDRDLEAYVCSDAGCSEGENTTINTETGFYGIEISAITRSDGRPIITYWHSDFQDLHAFNCDSETCSDGTVLPLEEENQVGYGPSVAIDGEGRPLIAYASQDLEEVRLYLCFNTNCDNGTSRTFAWGARSVSPEGLTVRTDGTPVILYKRLDDGALKLVSCFDGLCENSLRPELDPGPVESGAVIALHDNTTFVAAVIEQADGSGLLKMFQCLDYACEQVRTSALYGVDAGPSPGITLRPDGSPLIAVQDRGSGQLMLVDIDLSLVDGTGDPPVLDPAPPESPLVNSGFEDRLSGWFVRGGGTQLCNRLDRGIVYSDTGSCAFLALSGKGISGAVQTLPMVTWGQSGEIYTLSYRVAGRSIPEEALAGSRIILRNSLTGEEQRITCLEDISASFTYVDAGCSFTAEFAFDSIEIGVGWARAQSGYLAVDNVELTGASLTAFGLVPHND